MGFLWLDGTNDPHNAEYARAYERAIKDGSIDSVISWELSGFKTRDGTLLTDVPENVKAALRKNPRYDVCLRRVDVAVRALRQARYVATVAMPSATMGAPQ